MMVDLLVPVQHPAGSLTTAVEGPVMVRRSRVGHPHAPFPPRKYTRPFEPILETVTVRPTSTTSPLRGSTCSTTWWTWSPVFSWRVSRASAVRRER